MSLIGTDIVSLACIVGSGALGGIATLAAMGGHQHADHHCQVEAVDVTPEVMVVTDTGARSVVVRRDVRVHSSHDCASEAHVVFEPAQMQHKGHVVHLEALEHLEGLKHLEALEHLDALGHMEDLNIDLEGLNIELEGLDIQLEAMGVELDQEIQRRIEEEMAQVEILLKKKGKR